MSSSSTVERHHDTMEDVGSIPTWTTNPPYARFVRNGGVICSGSSAVRAIGLHPVRRGFESLSEYFDYCSDIATIVHMGYAVVAANPCKIGVTGSNPVYST